MLPPQAAIHCPACGAEEPPGARFCKTCGSSLEAPAPPAPADQEASLCPKCGAQEPPGARFCKACGSALEAAPTAPAPLAAVSQATSVCPRCGAQEPPGAQFCKACGAPLTEVPASPSTLPVDENEPLASSDYVQEVVAVAGKVSAGGALIGNLQRARQDPSLLLQTVSTGKLGQLTRGRLNMAEVLAVLLSLMLLVGFYAFGLYRFGWQAMIQSGTPVFMGYLVALVVGLATLRGPLDRLLAPVFQQLTRIPPKTRLVLGLVAPALWCIYDSADVGNGFWHAGKTVTIATALGHVLLRSVDYKPPAGTLPPPPVPASVMVLGLVLALRSLGWADDCSSPEDAMDTTWIGPPIKGLVSTIISAAVNGQTVMTKILKPPGDKPADPKEKPPFYRLNLNTQNRRTDLALDGEGLWVYAWVQVVNPPPGFDAAAATDSIAFSSDDSLSLSAPQGVGGRKAVYVKGVTPPGGEAATSGSLAASVVLAGQPVRASVTFQLSAGYELVVSASSEWSG